MFNNRELKRLYKDFLEMFEKEGDVYSSLKSSIEEDYEHKKINSTVSKTVLLQVLKLAGIEYFKRDIEILDEEQIIEEYEL